MQSSLSFTINANSTVFKSTQISELFYMKTVSKTKGLQIRQVQDKLVLY